MNDKPNYVAITLLLFVVLLLFQLVGMSLGLFDSDYEVNRYAQTERAEDVSAREAAAADGAANGAADVAIWVSPDASGDPVPAVTDACYYLRLTTRRYTELTDEALAADLLVVAREDIADGLPALQARCDSGKPVVYAMLPSLSLLQESEEARALLGVKRVRRAAMETTAVRMYKGFFLGGEALYKDETPTVPYFTLMPGFKVHLMGLTGDVDDENAALVPLLWRASVRNSMVCVVNGDYLQRHSGIGFFTAILADLRGRLCYPVINAQTMMVHNFPYLSIENDEQMRSWYHQTSEKLFFNSVLPDVTSVFNLNQYPLSCFFTGALDGQNATEIKWSSLQLYIRLIVGRSGEMGISGASVGDASGADKLLQELSQMKQLAKGYTLTLFSPGGMAEGDYLPLLQAGGALEDIRTLVAPMIDGEDIDRYRYVTDDVLQLPVTMNVYQLDGSTTLAHRSVETALLASNLSADTLPVLYPSSEDDDWVRLYKAWADHLSEVMYPFRKLDKLSVSEADLRARAFLNLRYQITYGDSSVSIHFDVLPDEAYFVLRVVDSKLDQITGAEAKELEAGVYLLTIREADVTATLIQDPAYPYGKEAD